MKIKKDYVIYLLGIIIPLVLCFRALFFKDSTAWGDAPFFWNSGLVELFSEPQVWTNRDISFGGVNNFLWISPLMALYAALGSFLGLGSHLINKVLFYFPAIGLSVIGSFLIARRMKVSKQGAFFTSILYVLNTYFILLIDGGQLGVALAYGLFPFAVLTTLNYTQKPLRSSLTWCLVIMLLLILADPRVAILAVFFVLILNFKRETFRALLPLAVAVIFVNLYWLIPLLSISGSGLSSPLRLQLTSLLNGIFLFQPHWPGNIFGKVAPPPFYFVGLPLLFLFTFWKEKSKLSISLFTGFLIFVFLLKADTYPLGQLYSFFVNSVPFGSAFRDSSKFFIPLLLTCSLLLGMGIDKIKNSIVKIGIYGYLLFLIWPVFAGKLNFVLSGKDVSSDLEKIAINLQDDSSGFFRASWFTQKNQLAYHTSEKQAIDASTLADLRPLAIKNVGDSNRFNFIDNQQSIDWLRLFGIKYLIFGGNPRIPNLSKEEQQDWQNLLSSIDKSGEFKKKDWDTQIPVYEIDRSSDHLLSAEKAYMLVGSDEEVPANAPFIYVEDGRFSPKTFKNISTTSASLVFNNKSEKDFSMSFLQDYFLDPSQSKTSQWAYYVPEDYLKWKYELLIRDIDTKEFDYGKGIAFSTQANEKIVFEVDTSTASDYMLALRALSGKQSKNLQITVNGKSIESMPTAETFSWHTSEVDTSSKKTKIELINDGGTWVINTFALIPKDIWNSAQKDSQDFIKLFPPMQFDKTLEETKTQKWGEIEFQRESDTAYKIIPPKNARWIFFSDRYHPQWKLRHGSDFSDSIALFSSFNGFYIDPLWKDTEIIFTGQRSFHIGMYISALAIVSIIICLIF